MEQVPELLVFGIENPLLDLSKEFSNDEILKKYKLQHGHASLATEEQKPLYDELWKHEDTTKIPGGSTLNTIRSANFMLSDNHPGKCAFFGSIGKDEVGRALEVELEKVNIHGNFYKDDTTPTGTCAVIVVNNERTLCANLAACVKYPTHHLRENMKYLE
jgi:adenosine kinase